MDLTRQIAELERQVAANTAAMLKARADLAGSKAQLAVLQEHVRDRGELTAMQRTDAILEVLRRASSIATVDEIEKALAEGGREDEPRSVRATLSYLRKQGRISRTARGAYVMADL